MEKKNFYCHEMGYVSCAAPIKCNHDCARYKAVAITGVKYRKTKEFGLTGYINGMTLVSIK